MTDQNNAAQAAEQDPLSDEYVNAVIQRYGYQSPETVIARLYQWMGRHGGENGVTLLMYEAHKALVKLRAPVADTPRVDDLMAKWDDDGATRGPAFIELRDLARALERRAALASAPVDPEAAEVDSMVRVLENLETWRAEDWNELVERRPAILALLRPLVMASAPGAGHQPYPAMPEPDVTHPGEQEDSDSRAAVETAMRAAHDRGYSVGWDHGKEHASAPVAGDGKTRVPGDHLGGPSVAWDDGAQSDPNQPESRASIESTGGALAPVAGEATPVARINNFGNVIWLTSDAPLNSYLYAAPQTSEAVRDAGIAASVINVEAAAMTLAECMHYPWAHMPEQGRAQMRIFAQSVVSTALSAQPGAQRTGGSDAE